MSFSLRACVLVLLATGLTPVAHAAEPTKPAKAEPAATPTKAPASTKPPASAEADDELLEFLGGEDADTGDEDWLDYLSQADIEAARQRRAATEGKK